ncbi:phospholipase D-like domain-containing protein [Methanospirillum sp.]|uniref:phospholipase D-like domain-containing protein n=1 Tax=Methanospirillum sp. TaxID=45200 RepID=UPI002CBFA793|nr:phospholipase D-like domain-containing protein [Methanospirillum sp.]HPP77719.1 phospholipase D-like domain-containing protein [Methanospirillum sp.]
MYHPLALLLIFILLAPVSAGPYFLEVYPDTWMKGDEDEYITIGWDDLPGPCTISDGEGTITLLPGYSASRSCTIARNGEQYKQVWGEYPAWEIIDSTPAIPQVTVQGRFQLSNKKDDLTLSSQGIICDTVTWPGTFQPRKGQIHIRSPDGRWDTRILMAGGTRLVPKTVENVTGIGFVSPDCSRQVLEETIKSAKQSILLNIYEFTDARLSDLLCDAINRGVKVSVLLEGGPVGGMPAEELSIIQKLSDAGAEIMVMEGAGEVHAPYRYDHAKYLVADGMRVLITTENFKEHSFPPAGYSGNRGWGVALDSVELASIFTAVFDADSDGPGVRTAQGRPGSMEEPVTKPYRPVFVPVSFTGASVTPVFSPDTSILVADLINTSRSRVWIQQAYIKEYPKNGTNPFLAAAIDAARRGVDVRILLDGYYYNIEGEQDNDEMVTSLKTLAAQENIPLQAEILYPEKAGLLKVHTKGVIADDQVLISSMNWNENSACFNREAGVIIRSSEAASYFASVFLTDWAGKKEVKAARGLPETDTGCIQMITLAGVLIILILLYRRYHRT